MSLFLSFSTPTPPLVHPLWFPDNSAAADLVAIAERNVALMRESLKKAPAPVPIGLRNKGKGHPGETTTAASTRNGHTRVDHGMGNSAATSTDDDDDEDDDNDDIDEDDDDMQDTDDSLDYVSSGDGSS